MTAACVTGAISWSTSSDFPNIENSAGVKPLILPPGCARLVTKPLPTRSPICKKTIGML
jgi:hypothetical protein